jgi:hypothetical protein
MAIREKDDPLNIFNELKQIDNKNYDFFDSLDENQQKAMAPYVIMKWGANVIGSSDLQSYYIIAANIYANENMFDLYRHKKLQYLMCCAMTPKIGFVKHYWMNGSNKQKKEPIVSFIEERFPDLNNEEIKILLQDKTREELKEWLQQYGLQNQDISKLLVKKK